jgi:hypothetical protein
MTVYNNMGLESPNIGDTDYPADVSSSFQKIDDHDHTSGKGLQIPTGGIVNLAVTAAKLAANAVETAKIQDGAVTFAKQGQPNWAISALSFNDSVSGTTYQTMRDGSLIDVEVTLTLRGGSRPVEISLVPNSPLASVSAQALNEPETTARFRFRDTTNGVNYDLGQINSQTLSAGPSTNDPAIVLPPSCLKTVIFPTTTGATTFVLQAAGGGPNDDASVVDCNIFIQEL